MGFHKSMPDVDHLAAKVDCGRAGQPAMDRRLKTYTFRSLPQPQKRASAWMIRPRTDFVVWAGRWLRHQKKVRQRVGRTKKKPALMKTNSLLAIRALSLPAFLTQDAPADEGEAPTDDIHLDDTDSSPADNRVKELQNLIEQSHPGTLRRR